MTVTRILGYFISTCFHFLQTHFIKQRITDCRSKINPVMYVPQSLIPKPMEQKNDLLNEIAGEII